MQLLHNHSSEGRLFGSNGGSLKHGLSSVLELSVVVSYYNYFYSI